MPKRTTEDIYRELTAILRDVFDNEDLVATPQLNAGAVEGWDSMGNVRLILAIEQEFRLRFAAGEIAEIQNVGELVDMIARKI